MGWSAADDFCLPISSKLQQRIKCYFLIESLTRVFILPGSFEGQQVLQCHRKHAGI